MKAKVIAVDIDGVLADFNTAYGELFTFVAGADLFPKGWREAIQAGTFPTSWHWEKAAGYTPDLEQEVWNEHILQEGSSFWESLEPLPGAIDSLRRLHELTKEGHAIYFITHRIGWNAKGQSEAWLRRHGMANPTVIVAEHKWPVLHAIEANMFIDDKLQTCNEVAVNLSRWDAPSPLKGHLYLKDAPWNQVGRHPDLKVVSGVQEMLEKEGLL